MLKTVAHERDGSRWVMWVILENCGTDIMQMSACTDITHTLDALRIKEDGGKKNALIVKETELIVQHWHSCHLWLALAQILHQEVEDDLHVHGMLEGPDVSRWGIRGGFIQLGRISQSSLRLDLSAWTSEFTSWGQNPRKNAWTCCTL